MAAPTLVEDAEEIEVELLALLDRAGAEYESCRDAERARLRPFFGLAITPARRRDSRGAATISTSRASFQRFRHRWPTAAWAIGELLALIVDDFTAALKKLDQRVSMLFRRSH